MFQVEINRAEKLLRMTFEKHVDAKETAACLQQVEQAIKQLEEGFRVLTDLSRLEKMDYACAPHIQRIMDVCNHKHVVRVVRVIPEIRKDIGFNVMAHFHYRHDTPSQTCQTLQEAMELLAH